MTGRHIGLLQLIYCGMIMMIESLKERSNVEDMTSIARDRALSGN